MSVFICLPLHATPSIYVPYRWTVNTARPAKQPLEIRRGETVALEPQYISYDGPIDLSNVYEVLLRYRSADMAAGIYYSQTGTVINATNGQVRIVWGSSQESTQSVYQFDVKLSGSDSASLKAYGTIKLFGDITGTETNVPHTVTGRFDWASVEHVNIEAAPFANAGDLLEIENTLDEHDAALDALLLAADSSNAVATAIAALSNNVTVAYGAADAVLSNALQTAYEFAVMTVSNALYAGYVQADSNQLAGITAAYQAAITSISNVFASANTSLSNNMWSAFQAGDVVCSNALHAAITNLQAQVDAISAPDLTGYLLQYGTGQAPSGTGAIHIVANSFAEVVLQGGVGENGPGGDVILRPGHGEFGGKDGAIRFQSPDGADSGTDIFVISNGTAYLHGVELTTNTTISATDPNAFTLSQGLIVSGRVDQVESDLDTVSNRVTTIEGRTNIYESAYSLASNALPRTGGTVTGDIEMGDHTKLYSLNSGFQVDFWTGELRSDSTVYFNMFYRQLRGGGPWSVDYPATSSNHVLRLWDGDHRYLTNGVTAGQLATVSNQVTAIADGTNALRQAAEDAAAGDATSKTNALEVSITARGYITDGVTAGQLATVSNQVTAIADGTNALRQAAEAAAANDAISKTNALDVIISARGYITDGVTAGQLATVSNQVTAIADGTNALRQAAESAAATDASSKTNALDADISARGYITSAAPAFTNGTTGWFDGVHSTSNGVYVSRGTNNYWILLP